MTESVNSSRIDEREKLLLRDMKKSLRNQLNTQHSCQSMQMDEKKARYPIGIYGFDEAIDSEINSC